MAYQYKTNLNRLKKAVQSLEDEAGLGSPLLNANITILAQEQSLLFCLDIEKGVSLKMCDEITDGSCIEAVRKL